MLKPSARNSSRNLSVSAKDLVIAASKFHAPSPRKAFLVVMVAGNGPKSETPRVELKGNELPAGKFKTEQLFAPRLTGVPLFLLVRGADGTYLGMPTPEGPFAEK